MNGKQYDAHTWLSRTWDTEAYIQNKVDQRDKLNSWGVGQYDAKHIPANTGENTSETKLINYTELSSEIEKKISEYMYQTSRTEEVINKVSNKLFRNILYGWYINHKDYKSLCSEYNYGSTQIYAIRAKALDAVYPFIPLDEIPENKYKSMQDYKIAE